jgi:hypothetical protein
MAREYIYTGPGGPTGAANEDIGTSALNTWNPLNLALSFLGGAADFGVDALKGSVDLGKAQGKLFDKLGRERPGMAQFADSGAAKFIQSIPEHSIRDKLQEYGTFGQREEILQQPGGEGLLQSAEYLGLGAALPY